MPRLLLLASVIALGACAGSPKAPANDAAQAPAFRAPKLGGGEQVFDPKHLEHPTLFVFWATWCQHCQVELPEVVALEGNRRGQLDVIGVSVDTQPQRAVDFVKAQKIVYPNISDETLRVADLFKVSGTPSFVLVERGGHVVQLAQAFDDQLRAAIDRAVQ